jgi:hypothetical protein
MTLPTCFRIGFGNAHGDAALSDIVAALFRTLQSCKPVWFTIPGYHYRGDRAEIR